MTIGVTRLFFKTAIIPVISTTDSYAIKDNNTMHTGLSGYDFTSSDKHIEINVFVHNLMSYL